MSDPKKILIVKIGAIGDVIMALPLLTHFKKKDPNIHITWVAGKTVEPILRLTQRVDQVLTVDEQVLFKSSVFKRIGELTAIQAKLAGKRFDMILTGHVDWRYRLISLTARSKDRRFFQRGKQRQCPVPGRYHGCEYLRLASSIDDADLLDPELPHLDLPKSSYAISRQPTIVLAPGGAKNMLSEDALRRWPIRHYASLARMFVKNGIEVVITGIPSDAWVLPFFEGISFKNLIGQLDLIELLGFLNSSELLITHDSGPLHLAKLARCKAIGLFGPTNPWEKVSLKEGISVIWGGEHLACRPCYDGKTYAPCKRNLCLETISPLKVYEKALEILSLKASAANVDRV